MNKSGCYLRKIHNQLEAGFNRKYKKIRADQHANTGVPE